MSKESVSPQSYHEYMFDENDVYLGEVPPEEELDYTPVEVNDTDSEQGVVSIEPADDEPFPGYNAMLAERNRRLEAGERDPSEHADGMSHVSSRRQDRLDSENPKPSDEKPSPINQPKNPKTTDRRKLSSHGKISADKEPDAVHDLAFSDGGAFKLTDKDKVTGIRNISRIRQEKQDQKKDK